MQRLIYIFVGVIVLATALYFGLTKKVLQVSYEQKEGCIDPQTLTETFWFEKGKSLQTTEGTLAGEKPEAMMTEDQAQLHERPRFPGAEIKTLEAGEWVSLWQEWNFKTNSSLDEAQAEHLSQGGSGLVVGIKSPEPRCLDLRLAEVLPKRIWRWQSL